MLTVTDGTHTAHIHLHGDYTGVTFVAASDGQGGTVVTDTPAKPHLELHAFIAAMAGHAEGATAPIGVSTIQPPYLVSLVDAR